MVRLNQIKLYLETKKMEFIVLGRIIIQELNPIHLLAIIKKQELKQIQNHEFLYLKIKSQKI